jgi:hypothetical protein
MPNCFVLRKKGSEKNEMLADVDVELCGVLNVPVHAKFWVRSWYDTIGLLIALGNQLGSTELRKKALDIYEEGEPREDITKILDYLETNYTSDAWYQVGR